MLQKTTVSLLDGKQAPHPVVEASVMTVPDAAGNEAGTPMRIDGFNRPWSNFMISGEQCQSVRPTVGGLAP